MQAPTLNRWMLRHPMMVRAVGLFVVSLFIVTGVVLPTFGKASELSKKITSKEKEEEELVKKVSVLSGLDQVQLAERVKILDMALPPKKDVVLYLSTIDGLSRELGLSFAGISLSPGDVTEASESAERKVTKTDIVKGVHSLETEIKINGTRERIYEFLRALESSYPLMQVKDVVVSAVGIGDSYTLSVRLGMLWATRDVSEVSGPVSLFTEKEEAYFQQLAEFRRYENPTLELGESAAGLGKYDLFEPIPQQTETLLQTQ